MNRGEGGAEMYYLYDHGLGAEAAIGSYATAAILLILAVLHCFWGGGEG